MSKFNKQQTAAIIHDNGPLLVIAGAGTGKTTVITERILNLINTGKASPSEILALTFTEKATTEMQERIDMALPLSYEEIWIKTFHGFCDNILREYGLEIGLDTGYKIMSNSETWMFIKKHLFEFDFDYYRPLGSPTKFIGALIQHFSRLRDEDVTPEKYQSLVISHQSPEEQAKINELAQAYQKYQELKMAENVMDYADLHFYTLRLFEKRKNILKEYQKRFKYILVDEFQDTNYAQNKIVLALADQHKNIMVVGDDDQCLPGDSKVSLSNKKDKKIKNIKPGEIVLSAIGRGCYSSSKVLRVIKNKKRTKFITFKTHRGNILTVTDNHKMFCFVPSREELKKGQWLSKLMNEINTEENVCILSEDLRIDLNSHHFSQNAVIRGKTKRIKINVQMCYRKYKDKNSKDGFLKNPLVSHLVYLETSSAKMIKKLKMAGIPLARAKKGWRIRKTNNNILEIAKFARYLQQITNGIIEYKFRVGIFNTVSTFSNIMPASNVFPGNFLPIITTKGIKYDRVIDRKESIETKTVYDLEIDKTHNFIAEGIVVHNSIYKWRGASLVNIMQFEKSFPDAEKVVLTENYRSNQDILDASYSLIKNNNPNRLEVQANVVKKLSGKKNQKNSTTVHPFGHYLEEVDFVVSEAKKMLDQNKTVAILVRASALAEPFIEEIKRRSLKYHFSGGASLFMQEEIKDLISILRFIANPTDDIALFRILNFPLFNYRMEFILETMNKARKENTPLFQMLKKQIIFSETTELLSHLIEFSKNKPASRVINEFFEKSGYFKVLTTNETAENYEKILNISEFSRKVASFERNNKETSTYHFVAYLELLEEASENPEREILDLDPNMIQIMTVHAAKGLEFDAVFLVNLVNHRFPTTNRKDAIEVPKELITEDLPTEDDHIAEERRLFYVACTRAKEKLFMTYSGVYDGKKAWKVSPFIKEALPNIEKVESRKQKVEKNIIAEREHRSLKSFKPVKISYTQLETWQNCPRKYQYRYVYKIPSPSAHSANFGASVHATLNEFYKALKKGEKPSVKLLKFLYEEYWIPYGYESKAHEMSRKKKGIEILQRFYEENSKPAFALPAYLERAFSLKMVSESSAPILLLGRIDRIDKLPDGTYEVIDYKTGKLKKQAEINKDLQLSIYARACRDIYKLPISKLSFYFLEDNQKISTTRSNEDLKNLETLVKEECEKIAVAEFKPTPGFPCSYCEYCILCDACKK